MKKALIIRYGAYGDIIHCSMLPRILHEDGYEVTFEYNYKGLQLLSNNPYIKKHVLYEPTQDQEILDNPDKVDNILKKRWERISKGYDKVINLYHSLEYGTIAMEGTKDIELSQEERQAKFDNNYYDFTLKWSGYEHLCGRGIVGEVYYKDKEKQIAKDYINKIIEENISDIIVRKSAFVLMVNLSGTGLHKTYPYMAQVVNRLVDYSKNVIVILTGDKETQLLTWEKERVINLAGKIPFRQALLMAKYCQGVVGCESGLMVGATMFGVRTCQLMTAASINCHVPKNRENDYSLQSNVKCSPCFTGPYRYENCRFDINTKLPICTVGFDKESVFQALCYMLKDWYEKDRKNLVFIFRKNTKFNKVKYTISNHRCPLCNRKNKEIFRKNDDCIYYKCNSCNILYTKKENIQNVYDGNYIKKYEGSKDLYYNQFYKFGKEINFYEGNFLEIGSVNSVILDCFKNKGLDTYFLDINKSSKFKDHKKILGSFEDVEIKEKFNVIWMSHVFEHFLDPLKAIKKLNKICNDNGYIYISMPDPNQINWKNPYLWNHWHEKEHFIMWYKESLINLFKNNGFSVKYFNDNFIKELPVTGEYRIIFRKEKKNEIK